MLGVVQAILLFPGDLCGRVVPTLRQQSSVSLTGGTVEASVTRKSRACSLPRVCTFFSIYLLLCSLLGQLRAFAQMHAMVFFLEVDATLIVSTLPPVLIIQQLKSKVC